MPSPQLQPARLALVKGGGHRREDPLRCDLRTTCCSYRPGTPGPAGRVTPVNGRVPTLTPNTRALGPVSNPR